MALLSKLRNFFTRRKRIAIPLLGGLFFLFGFLSFFLIQNIPALIADSSYNRLCREIFRQELSGNTLTLHYTLQNPADYGIYYEKAEFPIYSAENQEMAERAVEGWIEELSSIDQDALSEKNQYSYGLLARYLALQKQLAEYPYYDEPLSPNSGMQQTLPILLSEYRFEKRKDIDDYLALLSQVDDYYDGLLSYEREKAAAGLFMPESSVEAFSKQCREFITEDSMLNGSHFLIDSFAERLMAFQKEYPELLKEEKFEYYYQENLRILRDEVMPAYEKLADEMETLSSVHISAENITAQAASAHRAAGGLGATPDGKRYYELLIQKSTGSYREASEIQEMLYEQFEALRLKLVNMEKPAALSAGSSSLSVEEILAALQQDMKGDFPDFPSASEQQTGKFLIQKLPSISCDVKYISKSLSAYSAPAFYLTPPMDDYQKNVIYINPDSALKDASLFTTLAHEGFPGHLYQMVYARENNIADKKNPLRGLLDYPGYCEGWALYVELASYDYAANYYDIDPEYQRAARSLELCLCALLDFHIHYQGLTLSQTQALLSQFGIPAESAEEIYSYIVQEPAGYLKYYLSYLEILDLKQEAKKLWGEDYSDLRFHRFYLDAGPSDFASLEERLMETHY